MESKEVVLLLDGYACTGFSSFCPSGQSVCSHTRISSHLSSERSMTKMTLRVCSFPCIPNPGAPRCDARLSFVATAQVCNGILYRPPFRTLCMLHLHFDSIFSCSHTNSARGFAADIAIFMLHGNFRRHRLFSCCMTTVSPVASTIMQACP